MRTAKRVEQVQPFYVMDLLARSRELESAGRDIVHMEIGEPDFPTPDPIIKAGLKALATGDIHYTPALGLPSLRQAISDYYGTRYDVSISAERVVITPGSSVGLQMLMSALVDVGDEVLLTDPGYPCNRNFVYLAEGIPLALPVTVGTGFEPTPELVQSAWTERTRALMVATPANPTGALLSLSQLEALAGTLSGLGGTLIVDEIYQGITYGSQDITALSLDVEDLIVVNSFSKYFGMTGWRLGWLVVPPSLIPAMDRLAQNLYLSAPTVAQHAAVEALAPSSRPVLDERKDEFRRRRDYLYEALPALGFRLGPVPDGAFYLYADCSDLTDDSFGFARELLDTAGVAITPGKDFGVNEPQRHVRFAFTTDIARLREGVERIRGFLHGRR